MSHPKEDTVKNQTTKHTKNRQNHQPILLDVAKKFNLKGGNNWRGMWDFWDLSWKRKVQRKQNPKIASRKCNLKLQNTFLNIFYKSKGRGERPAHARAYRQNLHDQKPGGLKTKNHRAGMKGHRQVPVQDADMRPWTHHLQKHTESTAT